MVGKGRGTWRFVLSVQSDTLTTIERAEDVVHAGRTRDELTDERMRGLLADHANVDVLLDFD
ncbi:hypothetical protein [Halococcus thailandensis]|uniref:DRTGG domain protein n=1 Tax=Halococcus thailandensis JCM 13552 TaxID=1227457 RepID=M0NEV8_9EURY|nr:hypothetical protein [Halococcus thailandensis]EMA56083.1 DRTGG domain protein [Halococcus thailandensis JCM 13552]